MWNQDKRKCLTRICHNVTMELKMNEHFVLLCVYMIYMLLTKNVFYVDRVVVSEIFD